MINQIDSSFTDRLREIDLKFCYICKIFTNTLDFTPMFTIQIFINFIIKFKIDPIEQRTIEIRSQ